MNGILEDISAPALVAAIKANLFEWAISSATACRGRVVALNQYLIALTMSDFKIPPRILD